ncbi:transcriptional regulator [Sanguibacter keddieii DSM 10542]|uniref:Transcriptional regulator n=1 Tax=Sanguibacter keddieii (strain ATCC 51767 / DSM 10542 / NCFB 3025 / ST-74) TaxID=446469 RepID=D1BEP5_SANKS|nr:TetR/AcrR family transcriptional regulator [Sanguibacter keddieii]ACZ23331.1 transcriptional regulator [Sanguibacter keddieii DSM 10542]
MTSLGFPAPASTAACERADAARNREHLLVTARAIVDEVGVDALTMDGLARAAGLGKGTIFRRFGSRAGLLHDLLNDSELQFQHGFLSGPAPLGPGADPVDRLVAFGRERLRLVTVQGDILRSVESESALRYAAPAHAASAMHVQMLLGQAGVDGDLQVLTLTMLSSLDAALVLFETRDLQIDLDRLADAWEDLVRRVTRG